MMKGFEPIFQGRIHPAGWPFILIFACTSLLLLCVSNILGCVGFLLTAWCAYFFRDPVRVPPPLVNAIVAPADGLIVGISPAELPPELKGHLEGAWVRVSIFLNIFDVHVNRVPVKGRVSLRMYHPGQFLNASLDKASDLNERNTLIIDTPFGQRIAVVQIAGLIARRILCDANLGDDVTLGQRFGMIRFGSRVDLYLPATTALNVTKGQRTIAGETFIGTLGGRPT